MTLTQKQDNGWSKVLCNALDDMRQRKAFCDTIILADDGHMFTAHACILAAASPVLKTHLMSRDIHIQIDGITKRSWDVLLQFIYCGHITVLDVAETEQVLKAGMLLNLTGLAELCKNLFLAEANPSSDTVHGNAFNCQEETFDYDMRLGHGVGRSHVDEKSHVVENTFPMEATQHGAIENESFTGIKEPSETRTVNFSGDINQGQPECHEFQCKQEPSDVEYITGTNSVTEEMQTDMMQSSNNIFSNIPQCCLCGKVFTSAGLLATHRRHEHRHEQNEHPKQLPHACRICGKIFRQASTLGVHARTHTREQPFKCPICGRAFSDLSNLSRHKRVHTGERPYKCLVCGKTFSQVSHLKTHTRIHTGERPYMCPHCGKAFTRKSAAGECPCRMWLSYNDQALNLNERDVPTTVPMASGLAT